MTLALQWQALRLLLALALGALIGFERERLDHAAGLRTHALVCLGSALVIIVSTYGFASVVGSNGVELDPSRVAAQVVSGIGFLGAGTIIVQRQTVRGLTTAASIWTVAAIGLACGAGLYLAALIGTVLALIILEPLKLFERRFFRRGPSALELRVRRGPGRVQAIEEAVHQSGMELRGFSMTPVEETAYDRFSLDLGPMDAEALDALLDRLRGIDGVERVAIRR